MKKAAPVLCSLLASASLFAAETVTGFMEMKWGTTIESAKRIMEQRQAQFDSESSFRGTTLLFTGGEFSGMPAEVFSLSFHKNGLYSGGVRFPPNASTYQKLLEVLAKKYGKPFREGISSAEWNLMTNRIELRWDAPPGRPDLIYSTITYKNTMIERQVPFDPVKEKRPNGKDF